MFALFVRFGVKEGCEERFDALVAETINGIAAHEPDTLVYLTSVPASKPASGCSWRCIGIRTPSTVMDNSLMSGPS